MFTGIVHGIGRIVARERRGDGARIVIDAAALAADDVALGESIAVAGCCLTVVAKERGRLAFDVSGETLACTTGFELQTEANLERALCLSDRLGGHLVAGHVDGVGRVLRCEPAIGAGENRLLEVEAPSALARYIAAKGSIAVDGVSLTVNEVAGARFAVNLIPHTLSVTTLKDLATGARVNLEVDLIARYVARLQGEGGKPWN